MAIGRIPFKGKITKELPSQPVCERSPLPGSCGINSMEQDASWDSPPSHISSLIPGSKQGWKPASFIF